MLSKDTFVAASFRHAHYYLTILIQIADLANDSNHGGYELMEEHWLQIEKARKFLYERIGQEQEALELSVQFSLAGTKFIGLWRKLDEAIDWVSVGLDAASLLADKESQARLLNEFSRLYVMFKSIDDAKSFAEEALRLSLEEDFKLGEADALVNLGRIKSLNHHEIETALAHLEKAAELYRNLGETMRCGWAIHNLASIYDSQRELEKAHELLLQAIELFREANSQRYLSVSLARLGSVIEMQGNLLEGKKYIQEAAKIAEDLHDDILLTNCLLKLGINAAEQKEYRTYYMYMQEAYVLSQKVGIKDYEANALSNLGNYHFTEGEHHLAEQYYRLAMDVYTEMNRLAKNIIVVCSIAVAEILQSKLEHAFKTILQAWQFAQEIDYQVYKYPIVMPFAYLYGFHTDEENITFSFYAFMKENHYHFYYDEMELLERELRIKYGDAKVAAAYENRKATTWEEVAALVESILEKESPPRWLKDSRNL